MKRKLILAITSVFFLSQFFPPKETSATVCIQTPVLFIHEQQKKCVQVIESGCDDVTRIAKSGWQKNESNPRLEIDNSGVSVRVFQTPFGKCNVPFLDIDGPNCCQVLGLTQTSANSAFHKRLSPQAKEEKVKLTLYVFTGLAVATLLTIGARRFARFKKIKKSP